MATIQNPFRGINTSLGTSKRESTGEALAGLVSASLQTYSKVKEIDKKFDEEQDNKLGETEMIAYNDKIKQFRDEDLSIGADAMNAKDYSEYKRKQQKALGETVNGFGSSWAKTKSASLVSVFDSQISKADIEYQTELKDAFISEQIPEFSKIAVYGSEEFENMYKAISSFKTGKDFTKEEYVEALSKSNISYFEQVESKIDSGEIRAYNKDELLKIKNNSLEYIKNPILKSKIESAYSGVVNKFKTNYSNKLEEDNTELLYGNGSLVYSNAHKKLYNQVLNDDNIDASSKKSIINKITSIKESSIASGTKAGNEKLKNVLEIIKQTSGDNIKEQIDIALSSGNKDMVETVITKTYVTELLKNGKYEELNGLVKGNGTIEKDGTLIPYKKEEITNWINVTMQDAELKLKTMERGSKEYSAALQEIRQLEAKVDGAKSSIGAKAAEVLNNPSIAFTNIDEARTTIDYFRSYDSQKTKDSALMSIVGDTISDQIETLEKQYGEGNEGKLLVTINSIKNNVTMDYEKDVKDIENALKEKDIIEPYFSSDVEADAYKLNMAYAIKRWKKDNGLKKFTTSDENLESLTSYFSTYSQPIIKDGLSESSKRLVQGLYSTVGSGYDRLYIPNKKENKNIPVVLDKILGENIKIGSSSYDIPSQHNISIRVLNNDHIQILDRNTQALILDMPNNIILKIANSKFKTTK